MLVEFIIKLTLVCEFLDSYLIPVLSKEVGHQNRAICRFFGPKIEANFI